jgi:membrane-associated phospholipid phosphatase
MATTEQPLATDTIVNYDVQYYGTLNTEPPEKKQKPLVKRLFFIIRKKILPFAAAGMFCTLIAYLMSMAQVYVQDLTNTLHLAKDEPVFDQGFRFLPHLYNKDHIPDYYVISLFGFVVLTVFINRRLLVVIDMLRRMLVIVALIYCIRSISISITLLPNPYRKCVPSPVENYGKDALLVMLFIKTTCQDCFFSGHTVFIACTSMLWYDYLNARLLFRLPAILFAIVGGLLILMCHFHYSVDVMFGFLISYFIWKYFHSFIHRVERWLVRRQQKRWKRGKRVRQTYTKLAKQFLTREVGQVENEEDKVVIKAEPLMHPQSIDSFNVFITAGYLRFVIWFESWDDFLAEKPKKMVLKV